MGSNGPSKLLSHLVPCVCTAQTSCPPGDGAAQSVGWTCPVPSSLERDPRPPRARDAVQTSEQPEAASWSPAEPEPEHVGPRAPALRGTCIRGVAPPGRGLLLGGRCPGPSPAAGPALIPASSQATLHGRDMALGTKTPGRSLQT